MAQMAKNTGDVCAQEVTANLVAHALSHGFVEEVVLTEAQSAKLCQAAESASPASPALRRAAMQARKFHFAPSRK